MEEENIKKIPEGFDLGKKHPQSLSVSGVLIWILGAKKGVPGLVELLNFNEFGNLALWELTKKRYSGEIREALISLDKAVKDDPNNKTLQKARDETRMHMEG